MPKFVPEKNQLHQWNNYIIADTPSALLSAEYCYYLLVQCLNASNTAVWKLLKTSLMHKAWDLYFYRKLKISPKLCPKKNPQLLSFGPWVESCSHMKKSKFRRCSGLRHSSPSPALQHCWTYSCDLIRWFPLATKRHKVKQGEGITHRVLP